MHLTDPTSSWQTRLKGKTYKALLGKTAYYGDHVELSDEGNDFATQTGIGAVPGTKFTWPKDNPYATEGKFVLTGQCANCNILSAGLYICSPLL